MKLSSDIRKKIIRYFSEKPEIEAVYLYGSQAKGFARSDSDIDLAILVNDKGNFRGFDIPQTRYLYDLGKITHKEFEVQNLESCPVDFAHRVISEGKILLGIDSKKRVEFEEKILREFFDMKPSIDEYFVYLSEIARKGELGARYI
ncbi:hypothetical protein A2865_04800 [Candidatus Woesebacteria bacterium RIFCSPHIGHO2_01_FULL_39_17]|nr:MAG: hypothetical protein A2865_04800 [Candidatus Woesebacteria bacterium RIFCSPHIGHO2_01_FULL_39_17]